MLYTVENTSNIGKRIRIFDANGLEWTRCITADTETGRIERFVTDENGRVKLAGDDIEREVIFTAAPLLAVPIEVSP